VQQPLPLWIGGRSAAAIKRTARLGTGWLGGVESPEQVAPVVAAIKTESAAAGRPIDDDHYGAAFGYPLRHVGRADRRAHRARRRRRSRSRPTRAPRRGRRRARDPRPHRRVREDGVSKFVLRPIARGDDDMMAQTERLIAEVLPHVHH
jgi:alkanesulfonate monooxygenase SsuD/methylene tetrahydromethanopterin reductase-like flavin-dependent oxidoreductase (luciferase family)